MFSELKSAFERFRHEAGLHFFVSSLLVKALSFFTSWLALRLLDNEELGRAIYAYQLIAFLLPFMGLGIGSGLLRYGGMKSNREEQDIMLVEVLRKGLLINLVLMLLLWLFSGPLLMRVEGAYTYLQIFSFMLLANYLLELVKIYALTIKKNAYFAYAESTHAILLLLFVVAGARFADVKGYALAFVLAPLLTVFIWFFSLGVPRKLFFRPLRRSMLSKEIWRYGFYTSLGNVATQLLFVIDLLLVGALLNDPLAVTTYKYISLIPFSALFLSQIYMRAHFVELSRRMEEAVFIRRFIRRYHLVFLLLFAFFFGFCFVFSVPLLRLFDAAFVRYVSAFWVLCFGVGGIFLLRGLYGNLLSAAGKSHLNFYIALFSLLLNLVLNLYLIPVYGLWGAAFTSAVVMWFSGLLSLFFFRRYWP